jgi:hypothetical protein
MTAYRPLGRPTALYQSPLSLVVDRPDRRVSYLLRLSTFLHRPALQGHVLRTLASLAREWCDARFANLRERIASGPRLRKAWLGADPLARASSVAVYIHYAPDDRVSDMVLAQVEEYRSRGFTIVFISMCRSLDEGEVDRLRRLTGLVLLRRNFALDFGAWHDVVPLLADLFPDLRELLLVNDSVCGPLTSLLDVFACFRAAGEGLFGLTENLAPRPHLQSYLLLARGKPAVADLLRFIGQMHLTAYKRAIIRRGEVRLSEWMRRRGHVVAALHGYESVEWFAVQQDRARRRLRGTFPMTAPVLGAAQWLTELRRLPVNPTHSFWYELVECCGFPFIKTEVLVRNPLALVDVHDWRQLIPDGCEDVRAIIEDHLRSMSRAPGPPGSSDSPVARSDAMP